MSQPPPQKISINIEICQPSEGGLSSIQKGMDIGGEPHKLAYINSDESSLLKAIGGQGKPMRGTNGIPAYAAVELGHGGLADMLANFELGRLFTESEEETPEIVKDTEGEETPTSQTPIIAESTKKQQVALEDDPENIGAVANLINRHEGEILKRIYAGNPNFFKTIGEDSGKPSYTEEKEKVEVSKQPVLPSSSTDPISVKDLAVFRPFPEPQIETPETVEDTEQVAVGDAFENAINKHRLEHSGRQTSS